MPFKPRSIRRTPDRKNDLQKIFSAHVVDGTLEQGIEFFRSIVVQTPNHSLAWLLLGRLREAQNDYEKAYTAFHESALAMQRSPSLPIDAKASRFLDVTKFCLQHGWPERARLNLNSALVLNPGHPGALQLRHQVERGQKSSVETSSSSSTSTLTVAQPPTTAPQPIPPVLTPNRPPGPELVESEKRGKADDFADPPISSDVLPGLKRANAAFTQGDLEQAEYLFLEAIKKNSHLSGAHVGLAQTYARRNRFDLMEEVLDRAVRIQTDNDYSVAYSLGQAYMKQGKRPEVIEAYEKAIQLARTDAQKVGPYQWIGKAYTELGDLQAARRSYQSALALAPTNGHIRERLIHLDSLNARPSAPVPMDPSPHPQDSEDSPGWGDEDPEPDLSQATQSAMLTVDKDRWQWTDSAIIGRGGIVCIEDTLRLMGRAKVVRDDFNAKAALFLEAAKALSSLPSAERIPAQQEDAFQRFASQKGGFYLLQLLGEAKKQPQPNVDRLIRLRDAACAYYIEAMKIQQRRQPGFVLFILRKYLQAILITAVHTEADKIYTSTLKDLIDQAGRGADTDPTLLTSVARGLLELGRTQMGLVRLTYDDSDLRRAILAHTDQWRSVLRKLGATEGRRLSDVMRSVIKLWQENVRRATSTFSQVYNYPVTLANIGDLRTGLEELAGYEGVFCDTDRLVLRDIFSNVLNALIKYNHFPQSAAAERNLVAAQIRQSITTLREGIQEYPTYWTRVMFEPLLASWERLLGHAEHIQLAEVRPVLSVRLESKHLPLSLQGLSLVFSVSNTGQGTATDCLLEVEPEFGAAVSIPVGSIQPDRSATAQLNLMSQQGASDRTFLNLRYRIGYDRPEGRETSAWFEDVVHLGNFVPISRNPFMDGPPVEDALMFKGREEVMSQILRKLQSEDRVKSTLFFGITRTGKTSILKQLKRRTSLMTIHAENPPKEFRLLPLLIAFDKCARDSTDDFFHAFFSIIAKELDLFAATDSPVPLLEMSTLRPSLTGLEQIVETLYDHKLYPLFLIDEFSVYKTLVDKHVLDATFLSRVRHFALDERRATFVFAGTYDLKKLTSDPAYGIIGQLVSTDQIQVGRISDHAAGELVRVINDELFFSDSAVERILQLSGRIPYFIQLICKNCVYYANHFQTPSITHVEVERVVDYLIARQDEVDRSIPVQPISVGAFQANVWSESDSPLATAVIAALCFQGHSGAPDAYFGVDEIERFMKHYRAAFSRMSLLEELEECCSKQIVEIRRRHDGSSAYRISVDLFRRWFSKYYSVEWAIGRLRDDK